MNTLESMKNALKAETTTKTERMASPAQVLYYTTLCKTAGVEPKVNLSMTAISTEIEAIKKLVYNRATDGQKNALKADKAKLNLTDEQIDKLSFDQASAYMEQLNKLLPATDKQIDRLLDIYRFGLIPVFPAKLTKAMASALITKHTEKLADFASNATQKQVNWIQGLQQKLGDVVMDVKELSKLTQNQASELITALKTEVEALQQVKDEERLENMDANNDKLVENLELSGKDKGLRVKVIDLAGATRKKLFKMIHNEILGTSAEGYSESALLELIEFVETFAKDELETIINEL